MTVTASSLYMNWTGVTVTPLGGSAMPLKEITDIDVDRSSEMKRWYADAAKFPLALSARNKTRKITIRGGAINLLSAIPEDTPCTVVGILNDLNNGITTGALTITCINAIVASNPFKGKNNDFGTGDLTFEAFSTDGTTDPLTIAIA
jgi:hypothetical protein